MCMCHIFNSFPVAAFVVPAMAIVVEGSSATMVCCQMIAAPAIATLSKEIVVKLSTMDATGML